MTQSLETIFALASAAGKAGVAVVRISGPAAGQALLSLAPALLTPPTPRMLSRVDLYEPESKDRSDRKRIDQAMSVYFQAPSSFTGEDVVELHVHGGIAVLDGVMAALIAVPGCRPAGPGEFSKRAFENGKMDLTAIEAIADLVDAETQAQRDQALTQMSGALCALYEDWRARLVHAIAYAEASIDFAEEDIPDDLFQQAVRSLGALIDEMSDHLSDNRVGERVRSGFRIVLTGAPNVGKSSLMNALARRDVAIVSDVAGTTRDVIEVPMDLGGFAATIIDTAGLRDSTDAVEQEGVRRARTSLAAADITVLLTDVADPEAMSEGVAADLNVINKSDLATADFVPPPDALLVSVKSGFGLDRLEARLRDEVEVRAHRRSTETPPLTRVRHRDSLTRCIEALVRAKSGAEMRTGFELVAEDMRVAANALGEITGRVDVEELLDRIFGDFCIGK